jgi:outer membrane protein assembly factor BamB
MRVCLDKRKNIIIGLAIIVVLVVMLLLIVMFLTLPSLIISGQVSVTSAENNSLALNSTLLWKYSTSNGVCSSPTIDNDVLYVGVLNTFFIGTQEYHVGSNFYALNSANGEKLWNHSIPVGDSSTTVADGIVYVKSFDGNVYAFNAKNGVKIWSNGVGGLTGTPAVADGIVYFGLIDGTLALNSTTGKEVWKYCNIDGGSGDPVVKDGMVFSTSSVYNSIKYINEVHALNASSGELIWDYAPNTSVSFPIIEDQTLYVGIGSNVSALRSIDGSLIWTTFMKNEQFHTTQNSLRTTAVLDNVLYAYSKDGFVYALNANNGEKIWSQSLGNKIETSPFSVASGAVYVGSNTGNLYTLNATNGEILWNYTISESSHAALSSPVVANGIVYIGSDDHTVYAFGNQAAPNASSNTLMFIIGAAVIIIIITLTVIIFLKKLKPKSSNRDTQKQYLT